MRRRAFLASWRTSGQGSSWSATLFGTGELIATPNLAAKAGMVFLWLMLFSCIIKVFFQIEIGRASISEGKTTLDLLNSMPGPRFRVHLVLWLWLFILVTSIIQQGATLGGSAQALRLAMPIVQHESRATADYQNEAIWGLVVAAVTIVLLLRGEYVWIERAIMLLVGMFTLLTLYTVFEIQRDPKLALTWADLVNGFSFKFPESSQVRKEAFQLAITAFGITGVGAAELLFYPYWCLEKGYGQYIGPKSNDDGWAHRAQAWMKILKLDVWFAMIIFTVPTLAFYVLGATLLHPIFLEHGADALPKDNVMIERLSVMYNQTFGSWARPIFLTGAIGVLYSTLIVTCASYSRILVDWLALAGWLDRARSGAWLQRMLSILFPILAYITYAILPEPVTLVKIGGITQNMMLPIIGAAVLYLAYHRVDRRIRASKLGLALLWIAFIAMSVTAFTMAYASFVKLADSTPAIKK